MTVTCCVQIKDFFKITERFKVTLTKHILMTKSSNNSMETPKTKRQATEVIRTTQIHFEKGQRLVA